MYSNNRITEFKNYILLLKDRFYTNKEPVEMLCAGLEINTYRLEFCMNEFISGQQCCTVLCCTLFLLINHHTII